MSNEDKSDFDRWLAPIWLGFMVWGCAVGLGFILLIGADGRYHGVTTDLLIGTLLGLWLLRTIAPETGRQLGLVVAIGAAVIAPTVLAVVGLFVLLENAGIREASWLVEWGIRGTAMFLCLLAGLYGAKWIVKRLGLPLRNPANNPAHP